MSVPASPLKSKGRAQTEPAVVRWLLIAIALVFLTLFLMLPLAAVFGQAFEKGIQVYLEALREPDTLSSIKLTLITAAVTVPLNLFFGVTAAWAIAKFSFPGKNLLITLIDLPFSVSPVISGLIYVLIFGLQGWIGPSGSTFTEAPLTNSMAAEHLKATVNSIHG